MNWKILRILPNCTKLRTQFLIVAKDTLCPMGSLSVDSWLLGKVIVTFITDGGELDRRLDEWQLIICMKLDIVEYKSTSSHQLL